ncbi:MAG: hypothetical protein AAFY88_29255, partial [Acidobacteriota bacterium]
GGPAVGPWRPALATLGAALALLVAFSTQLPRSLAPEGPTGGDGAALTSPAPAPAVATPSTAGADVHADEVEAARRDIELAFAYLGQLGRTAESSVRRLRIDPSGGDDAP